MYKNVDMQHFCANNIVAARMNVGTVSGFKAFRDVQRELDESNESPELVNGCVENARTDTPSIEEKITHQEEMTDYLFVLN